MDFIPNINISNFDFNLPEEKIAQFPLSKRDESKLLIVKNGNISEDFFKNLLNFLPENGLMIRNETRVIQARLLFCKESGAIIELFCLEPVLPIRELQLAFEQKSGVVWKCLVGNSRRWKSGKLRKNLINKGQNCILQAERVEQASGYSMIRFVWDPPDISLSEILMLAGITPLPPYVTREANETDAERYQTIYSRSEGSVAAPTAGLHFTDEVLQKLISKNISMKEVVLHVGAGTFKPVSNENIREHEMHAETIIVRKTTIQKIIEKLNDPIITVGTTSIRTIESLYWHGVKLLVEKKPPNNIDVKQWDPYDPVYNCELSVGESLQAILNYMEARSLEMISGQTQLMIVPGYRFRISSILITNFHMPRSTLLLLVSAFIGQDWVKAYNYALHHDFRFLSYGDACLFYKQ